MNYVIREIKDLEISILEDFLYEAIFVPEGQEAPSKEIITSPELQVYIKDFGKKKDDLALVAECNERVIGAVWVRIMNDFGHIDDNTPSLSIAIYSEYRNKGVGTQLMKRMLTLLKERGYKQTSLSVQKENYAVQLYEKLGYKIVKENKEDYIMVYEL